MILKAFEALSKRPFISVMDRGNLLKDLPDDMMQVFLSGDQLEFRNKLSGNKDKLFSDAVDVVVIE